MCHTVSPAGMLCHLGAWGMASETDQHANMAFFRTKQIIWVYAQNCCFGCSSGQVTETSISTSTKIRRAVATFWLAAVNLSFEE